MNRYRREPWARTRTAARVAAELLGLSALILLGYAYILIADALINAPQPTERCFSTAVAEADYCRTQGAWK